MSTTACTKTTGDSTSDSQNAQTADYTKMSEDDLEVKAYDGDAKAAYQLGLRNDYGIEDTDQNFEKAMDWYQLAATNGFSDANLQAGVHVLKRDRGRSVDRSCQSLF